MQVLEAQMPASENLPKEWQEYLEAMISKFKDEKAVPTHANSVAIREAMQFIQSQGFPTTRDEAFHYLRVAEINPYLNEVPNAVPSRDIAPDENQAQISSSWIDEKTIPGCEENRIVLLNGKLQKKWSSAPALLRLEERASSPDSISFDDIPGAIAALGAPFPLHIVMEKSVPQALQILIIVTEEKSNSDTLVDDNSQAQTFPSRRDVHLSLRLESGIESTVYLRFCSLAEPKQKLMHNIQIHVNQAANSRLHWVELQEEHSNYLHLSARNFQLHRDAYLKVISIASGSKLSRQHFSIDLLETGAEAEILGAARLTAKHQCHRHLVLRHQAPHCTSRQHFKQVLVDEGRHSFDGTIEVQKKAQKSNAAQLVNNLILSDGARSENKPNLLILADDVKCSHGATVGQLDEEQLNYLQSRGLSREVASRMLTAAFLREIVREIPNAFLRNLALELTGSQFSEAGESFQKNLKKIQ